MAAATLIFFIISVCTFAILLMLAVALYLKNRSSASPVYGQADAFDLGKTSYSCNVELVVLDDNIQITNLEEKPMRMEASGPEKSLELVSSDQWLQKFIDGVNTYRLFASSADTLFEQVAVDLKVTPSEISIRPVMRQDSAQVVIWKMKPVLYTDSRHLIERQVFSGRLQKTLNFDRSLGKYFRIQVATGVGLNSSFGLNNRSNVTADSFLVLSLRIEAERVLACNPSGRTIEAVIVQEDSQSTLRRRLTEDIQAMPRNGVFCFSILSGKSVESKSLLRIRISQQSVHIEPYSKFGTVPLICDVSCPGRSVEGPLSRIISGEVLSELQLPRRTHRYVLAFYMRPTAPSLEAETSYTLQ